MSFWESGLQGNGPWGNVTRGNGPRRNGPRGHEYTGTCTMPVFFFLLFLLVGPSFHSDDFLKSYNELTCIFQDITFIFGSFLKSSLYIYGINYHISSV
jgi:hypothetical protein